MTRGDAVLEPGWSLEQLGAVCLNPGARAVWDERYESSEIKEQYTLRESLFHSKMKGSWPVSGRDIVGTSIIEYHEGKEYIIAMSSVVEPTIPEISSHVRADLYISGWILRLLEDGSISVSYIVHIHLNGSIPSAFVKMVQLQTPLCAGKVCQYARKLGFPPYVKKLEGRVLREQFDQARKTYIAEVDAPEEHGFFGEKAGNMVIVVSKTMFPDSFAVKTSIVESVHEKEEADGNTLVIIKHIKAPVVITISQS